MRLLPRLLRGTTEHDLRGPEDRKDCRIPILGDSLLLLLCSDALDLRIAVGLYVVATTMCRSIIDEIKADDLLSKSCFVDCKLHQRLVLVAVHGTTVSTGS